MLREIGRKIEFLFDTIMVLIVCIIVIPLLALVECLKEREEYR